MHVACHGDVFVPFVFGDVFRKSLVQHVVAHKRSPHFQHFRQIGQKHLVLSLWTVHKYKIVTAREQSYNFPCVPYKQINPVGHFRFLKVLPGNVCHLFVQFDGVEGGKRTCRKHNYSAVPYCSADFQNTFGTATADNVKQKLTGVVQHNGNVSLACVTQKFLQIHAHATLPTPKATQRDCACTYCGSNFLPCVELPI